MELVSNKFMRSSIGCKDQRHSMVRKTQFFPDKNIQEVFDRWIKNPSAQILIYGTQGNGKTTSLIWLYHYLVDCGVDVQYVSARDLVDRARERVQDRQNIGEMLNRFLDAGCLLLDDLGAERCTEFTFSDVIYPIINHRLDRENPMPTVMVSNLNFPDLLEWYGKSDQAQSNRFVSRIIGKCVEIYAKNPSYRKPMGHMSVNL